MSRRYGSLTFLAFSGNICSNAFRSGRSRSRIWHGCKKWFKSERCAPECDWYKDFGSFKLCGSGEYPRTVLTKGMAAFGREIKWAARVNSDRQLV
jgi:hypothetical protein